MAGTAMLGRVPLAEKVPQFASDGVQKIVAPTMAMAPTALHQLVPWQILPVARPLGPLTTKLASTSLDIQDTIFELTDNVTCLGSGFHLTTQEYVALTCALILLVSLRAFITCPRRHHPTPLTQFDQDRMQGSSWRADPSKPRDEIKETLQRMQDTIKRLSTQIKGGRKAHRFTRSDREDLMGLGVLAARLEKRQVLSDQFRADQFFSGSALLEVAAACEDLSEGLWNSHETRMQRAATDLRTCGHPDLANHITSWTQEIHRGPPIKSFEPVPVASIREDRVRDIYDACRRTKFDPWPVLFTYLGIRAAFVLPHHQIVPNNVILQLNINGMILETLPNGQQIVYNPLTARAIIDRYRNTFDLDRYGNSDREIVLGVLTDGNRAPRQLFLGEDVSSNTEDPTKFSAYLDVELAGELSYGFFFRSSHFFRAFRREVQPILRHLHQILFPREQTFPTTVRALTLRQVLDKSNSTLLFAAGPLYVSWMAVLIERLDLQTAFSTDLLSRSEVA